MGNICQSGGKPTTPPTPTGRFNTTTGTSAGDEDPATSNTFYEVTDGNYEQISRPTLRADSRSGREKPSSQSGPYWRKDAPQQLTSQQSHSPSNHSI